MYRSLIENVYNSSDIEHRLISENTEYLSSFVKVPPNTYPPRMDFEVFTHNLKKGDTYILKFGNAGRAVFAINDKEIKIVDIFLQEQFQGQSILKGIINAIKYFIKDYPTIEFITLNSLATGIIAWHKIGFEFYNNLDRISIIQLLSVHLGYRVKLEELAKSCVESNNCYEVLVNNNLTSIPMVLKVKK